MNAQMLARLILARREGEAQALATAFPLLSLEEAYATQDALDELVERERGWRRIGYKAGATNAAAQAGLKLPAPFRGRLYRETTLPGPAILTFAPGGRHRAVEAEVALEIGADLPARGAPWTAQEVRAATRALAPAIELVGSTFVAGGPEGAAGLIADFAGCALWSPGPSVADFSQIDPETLEVRVFVNGVEAAVGVGANVVAGGPFASAAQLANALNAAGGALRAGDWVTAGTLIAPAPAARDQTIVADFGPLGKAELRLV